MLDNLLIHRCKIQNRTGTGNDFGEQTYTYADTYTGVLCRFSSPKGSMRRLDSGEFVEDMPKLFLKADQAVSETNRVVGTSSGFTETYEILKVNKKYDGTGIHHITCDLKKVV